MKNLLEQIIIINNSRRINSPRYNIFHILGIENKEVLMCKVLADIINPKGMHGQQSVFLRLFLTDVLEIDVTQYSQQELDYAMITTEYLAEGRRIDIVIQIGKSFIPIEVKIYACDQDAQCYDYYHFSRKRDDNAVVYYLTLFGHTPSQESLKTLSLESIKCISFREQILGWIRKCILVNNDTDFGCILNQLEAALMDITDSMNKEMIEMVAYEISASADRLRSGIQIADALSQAKLNVLIEVMQEFEKQMIPVSQRFNLTRELTENWYEYKDKSTSDFFRGESTYPGINYVVNDIKMPLGYQLWFRIEVDWSLYAGLCVFDPKANNFKEGRQVDDLDQDTRKYLTDVLGCTAAGTDGWWAKWCYLPNGQEQANDDVPNFRAMNEAAINLADSDVRVKFVRIAIKTIENNLLEVTRRNDSSH